ncbi:condensation domain-containing protein, partial [Cupriavidus numazuensis]
MDDSAIYRIAQRFAGLSAEQRQAVYQRVLAEGMTAGQFPVTPRAPAASRDGGQPLSYAQSRQWFLWELEGGGSAYHITGALRLQGKLDMAAVRESFGAIVARHEALRTVFRANAEGLAEQWVMESGAFQFSEIDLTGSADAEAEAGRVARELGETPFELGTGPLLRVGLLRLAAGEHVLVVVMHHIVSDGWSVQLIVDE